jgi:hypothetical protein
MGVSVGLNNLAAFIQPSATQIAWDVERVRQPLKVKLKIVL